MRIALRRKLLFASVLTLTVSPAVAQNYAATPGAGLTFGAKLSSTVLYPYFISCDATTVTQCLAINASGQITVLPGNTANTTPWLMSVTAGGNTATVKAASTAAVATDPSLVSNESPNSQISVAVGTTGDAANAATVVGQLKQITTNTAAAIPAGTSVIGFTSNDPCSQSVKSNAAFSNAAGTFALVTGVAAKKIYVCSFLVVAPTAVSVSLAEGSSATCGTSAQAAVVGVATSGTAANGVALAANAGWTFGNGAGTVASTATAANYLCIFQSGTAQLAGNITYVQQ
jgi:hypothetical protein